MGTKRVSYDEKDGGFAFLASILFPLVLQLALQLVLMLVCAVFRLDFETAFSSNLFIVFMYICLEGGFFLTFALYNKRKNIDGYSASKIKFKLSFVQICYLICVPIICILAFNNFVDLFDQLLKVIGYNNTSTLPLPLTNFGWFALNVLLMAVLPAICEELLFRGIILNGLKKFGTTKAIFFTALLFALFHTSPSQTIYQFILGVAIGYAVVKTGSLISGIVVHFINNFAVLLINYIAVINGSVGEAVVYNAFHIFVSIVLAIAGALLLFFIYKFGLKSSHEKDIQYEKVITNASEAVGKAKNSLLYLWIGIALAGCMWVYTFIYYTF